MYKEAAGKVKITDTLEYNPHFFALLASYLITKILTI